MLDRLPSAGSAALRNPYAGSAASGALAQRAELSHLEQRSVSVVRADTFELSIQTAEGDVVTLDLSQQQTYSALGTLVRGDKGQTAMALDVRASNELNVQIAVKGDLSAKEASAINALVNQVNGVAQDFFAGDIDKATAAASTISIASQADTLSAYAFDMQTQEVRRAVSTYTEVAAATAPPPPPSEGGFLKNLLALIKAEPTAAASTPAPQTPV